MLDKDVLIDGLTVIK